jgi:hypothetical protein
MKKFRNYEEETKARVFMKHLNKNSSEKEWWRDKSSELKIRKNTNVEKSLEEKVLFTRATYIRLVNTVGGGREGVLGGGGGRQVNEQNYNRKYLNLKSKRETTS